MSETYEYDHDAISKISKAIAEYRQGITRIDREFDAACQRIDKSIVGLHGNAAKHGQGSANAQQQINALRQQSDSIEREIAKTEVKIAAANQGIAAVESDICALGQEKSGLEQQITARWLIEDIYYFFFEDGDKNRCKALQGQLDSAASRKSALEQTKRDFESIRRQAESGKTELQKSLEEIQRKIAALEKAKGLTEEQAKHLASERQKVTANRATRKSNWLSVFANEWEKTTAEVERAGSRLRRQQPAFVDFGPTLPVASEMPTRLLLGSQLVSFEKFSCLVPHSIPFPFSHALILPEDNTAQRRLAHHLLLRLLSALPPGQLEMTLIDPLKLGQSAEPFLPLLKVEQLVPQQRVLTRSNEIEAALDKLTDEVEELIQHRFNDKASNWSDYNANHADNPLRYKVVLLFDVPEQLSDKSLWFLERLCENGPRCGVLPIIAIDGTRVEDRRCDKFRAALETSTMRLDALLRGTDAGVEGLSIAYQSEQWPQQDSLEGFISTLAERCATEARFSKSMPDLWTNFAKGATTIGGFDIPIGWTPAGESVSLTLGATGSEHHALLAGKTGSGKSNLLHVMIHSLCEKYPPGEVDLYLLDYKESTEFTVYANPSLPHARLVATESDPEYGVTVLRHLVDELEKRARIFKTAGIRDFAEYRKASLNQLPRVLLVIDEFQVLFSDSRQVAEAAEQLLSQLLKQGRSFGIHILLATQTLKAINALSIGAIVTQLGCRIALACGQEDSAMILGSNNLAAAELKMPSAEGLPAEGIINNANGAKSGNIKFLIPLAESTFCREHNVRLTERAAKRGLMGKTRVFNGANLPFFPESGEYKTTSGQANALLLGEKLTFTSDTLTVPLTTRNAFNVLFSGYNDQIHDGLLASTLVSLAANSDFDQVIYFNGRGIASGNCVNEAALALGSRFKIFNDTDALPLQEILDSIGKCRTALIVDGLDSEKSLYPTSAFKVPKPGEPSSPADLLKRIADEGPRKGTFVFAFIDNWRRCAGPCKDLFALFELRVAYCMNEDDAGALVSGTIGKFKGIEKPNRAVFLNRMTNEMTWFRPYIQEDSI
jgi:S-DNA-T family DNA segregation ATPase FtsK/SpoIIIE